MTEWREAFCPMCGYTRGMRNITPRGKPWIKLDEENFWERTREFTGDKAFGVVKTSEGRGTMRIVRYYGIDEDVEGYFPLMKARLLAVIGEWLEKGWITPEEVEGAMK